MRFASAAILMWALNLPLPALQDARPRMIVFPLENGLESGSLSWVGEGIALSLSEQLSGVGIDAIPREERLSLAQESNLPANQPFSRASMLHIAEIARADYIVFGSVSGSESSLKVDLAVLDTRTLKTGGRITGNGSLAALPQIENDLAWLILSNNGLSGGLSREQFRLRARTMPNSAYARHVAGLLNKKE